MMKPIQLLAISTGVVLSACSEQTFTQLTVLDVFQQDRTNAVDLLVVIDNSCSMIEEQENLARNFEELINTFTAAETDWQIAVTTTDVESEKFRGLLMAGEDEIIVQGEKTVDLRYVFWFVQHQIGRNVGTATERADFVVRPTLTTVKNNEITDRCVIWDRSVSYCCQLNRLARNGCGNTAFFSAPMSQLILPRQGTDVQRTCRA